MKRLAPSLMIAAWLAGCAPEGRDPIDAPPPKDGRTAVAGGVSLVVPREARTSGFRGDPAVVMEDAPVYTVTGDGYRIAINAGVGRFDLSTFEEAERSGPQAFERLEQAGAATSGTLVFPRPGGASAGGWRSVSPTVTWSCENEESCRVARGVLSTLEVDPAVLHSSAPPPRAPAGGDGNPQGIEPPPIVEPPADPR